MRENIVQPGRSRDDMVHAHFMVDAYDYSLTHSAYVVIIAFPLQQ